MTLSLEQLANKSRFKRKPRTNDYDSYADEFMALYGKDSHNGPMPEGSELSKDPEFVADYDRLTYAQNEGKLEQATKIFDAMGDAFLDAISACMSYLRATLKTDPRNADKVIYSLELVVIILLLARLCGCQTASSVARYYKENYIQLQMLIPDLPSPKPILSESTVNRVMRIFSEDELQELLRRFFSSPTGTVSEMAQYDEQRARPAGLKDTTGFDGQEMGSTFARGEESRKKKGAHCVTVYNATKKTVLDAIMVYKKNHERSGFLQLLLTLVIAGTVVMCDALNACAEVSKGILGAGADFLLYIKKNAGNKELRGHVEATFNRESALPAPRWLVREYTELGHSRIATWRVEVLDADILDPRIKNPHEGVKTVVRYSKVHKYVINGKGYKTTIDTRYLISSLEFSEKTADQILFSILDYWGIEAHHGILDNPNVFNQDAVQGCSLGFLSSKLAINKIALNILRSARHYEAIRSGSTRPMFFVETIAMLRGKSVAHQLWYLVRYFNYPSYDFLRDVA